MKQAILLITLLLQISDCCGKDTDNNFRIAFDTCEYVWAGVIRDGHVMPFTGSYQVDFSRDNKGNQLQPLILTNTGKYVWSEEPYSFEFQGTQLIINDTAGKLITGKQGGSLAEAFEYACNNFFPPSGLMPDNLLFSAPQYNTWIEINRHQNQEDIIKYARDIIENGLPPGVFMIDDTWQEDYGIWDFHPGRFPDPRQMVDELHKMGFKIMLWICPFISPDQPLLYRLLKQERAFILKKEGKEDTWDTAQEPAMISWWNGVSALLDFSNPVAVKWFNAQLDRLVIDYNIDGFKFDAGDMYFYPRNSLSKGDFTPNEHCGSFTQFGLRFPLNEYRACWKMGGQPLGQRLHDKAHSWDDLQKLIPQMVVEGLCGYPFSCPDMIGGGALSEFNDSNKISQELIVRSAQCHALMPMMQFSVAPWRVLSKDNFEAVKKAVETRKLFTPLIMELAGSAAKTGMPVVTNLEFYFPHQGFARVIDQFMLGGNIMVAPMIVPGQKRKIVFPEGRWRGDDGKFYPGGKTYEVDVPIYRLPYFTKIE